MHFSRALHLQLVPPLQGRTSSGRAALGVAAVLVACTQLSAAATFPADWTWEASLRINPANVTGTHANMPILLTEANLPPQMLDSAGAGPALAGGADIRFTSDEAGTTELPREIVTFVLDGAAEIWVKVPSVTDTGATSFYVWWGCATATEPLVADPNGRNAVWSNGYLAVWHLGEAGTGSADDYADSTGNLYDSTSTTNQPTQVAGTIGSAESFDGSGQWIDVPSALDVPGDFTVQAWLSYTGGANDEGHWFGKADGDATASSRFTVCRKKIIGSGSLAIRDGAADTYWDAAFSATPMLCALTHDAGATTVQVVIDGVVDSSQSFQAGTLGTAVVTIGAWYAHNNPWPGTIDELRVSSVKRDTTWLQTDHALQSDPASFVTPMGMYYWVGDASSSWNDGNNWGNTSGGNENPGVPGADDATVFDAGSTQGCVIDADAWAGEISMTAGFTYAITFSGSSALTVYYGSLSQAGGTFDGTNAAAIDVGGTIDLTGGSFTSTANTLATGDVTAGASSSFSVPAGGTIQSSAPFTVTLSGDVDLAGTSGIPVTFNRAGLVLSSDNPKTVAASYVRMLEGHPIGQEAYVVVTGTAWDNSNLFGWAFGGPPSSGLVGHWKFDETSGTVAVDSSSRGIDGTLENMPLPATSVAGKDGTAYRFDGSSDMRVYCGNPASYNDGSFTEYSVCAWVAPNDTSTDVVYGDPVVNYEGGSGFQLSWDWEGGAGRFGLMTDEPALLWGLTDKANGQWYHVVATFESASGTARIYVNGVEEVNATGRTFTYNHDLRFGQHYGGRQLAADVDDIRIYDRPLSADEVAAMFQDYTVKIPTGSDLTVTMVAYDESAGYVYGEDTDIDTGDPGGAGTVAWLTGGLPLFWVGDSSASWSDPANWSYSSGGADALAVPDENASVTFDAGSTGNCSVDADAQVYGMDMQAAFAHVVEFDAAARTLTLGSDGISMAGGTFDGTNAAAINVGGTIDLSGGSFTSTANTLAIGDVTAGALSSFSVPAGGTIQSGAPSTVTLSGDVDLAGSSGMPLTFSRAGLVLSSDNTKTVAASYVRMTGAYPTSRDAYVTLTGTSSAWDGARLSGWGFEGPSANGLVGHWKLDEVTTGSVVDSSVNSYHGTNSGATVNQAGKVDACYSFDGTTNYLEIPALNLDSNTVTMTAWVNGHEGANGTGIVFCRDGSTVGGMNTSNGELGYHWNDNFWDFDSGLAIPVDTWAFVALVVEPTQATLYVDENSIVNTAAHGVEEFDAAAWIGRDITYGNRYWVGLIDDVRIYDRALSADEISAITRTYTVKIPTGSEMTVTMSAYDISAGSVYGEETDIDAGDTGGAGTVRWAFGDDYVWDGDSDADGDGTSWDDPLNWSADSGYPDDAGDSATISATSGAITTPGPLTIGALTIDDSFTGSLTLNGALTIDDSLARSGDLMLGGTPGAYSLDANTQDISIDGSWTKIGGTFLPSTGIVAFSGPSPAILRSGGTGAGNAFGNVTVNKPGGTLTIDTTDLEVTGTFELSDGTLDTAARGVTGGITVSGGNLIGSGTFSGAIAATGGVVDPGAAGSDGVLTAASADFSGGGTLRIDVEAYATPGTDFDQLALTGALTSGGSSVLELDLTGLAAEGTAQGIVTYGSASGSFTTVTLMNNAGGRTEFLDYAAGGGTRLDCTLALVDTYYWVGDASTSWSDRNNWGISSGGNENPGVPGTDDTAVFDAGSAQGCAVDANATLRGIEITAGFSNEITFSLSPTLSVYEGGISQAGGTFTGTGAASIQVGGPIDVTGGTFTGTPGMLLTGDVSAGASSTFTLPAGAAMGSSSRGPTAGLVGHWKLDETSGTTAADSSGNGHDGILTNMAGTEWTTGMVGGALEFNGASDNNDYIDDADGELYINGLTAITVSVWVKSDVTGVDRGILTVRPILGADSALEIRYDSGGMDGGGTNVIKCAVAVGGGTQGLESSSNSQTTSWQHLALTWSSGNQLALYINGSIDTPTSNGAARIGTISDAVHLRIGVGERSGEPYWDGLIDDVRIYNRALSASEIMDLAGVAPYTVTLAGDVDLAGTSGTPLTFSRAGVVLSSDNTKTLSGTDYVRLLDGYPTTQDAYVTFSGTASAWDGVTLSDWAFADAGTSTVKIPTGSSLTVTMSSFDTSAGYIYGEATDIDTGDVGGAGTVTWAVPGGDYVWDGDSDADGDGTSWDDPLNWTDDFGYPDDASESATISATSGAITTPGPLTIGALTVDDSFTGSLTLNGALTINDSQGRSGNLTLGGTPGAYGLDANTQDISIDGSWTKIGGTFTPSTGIVDSLVTTPTS